jgi:hypothetical protein
MASVVVNHYTDETYKSSTSLPTCERCQALDLDEAFHQADEFYRSAREGLLSRSKELCKARDGVLYYDNAFLVHHFQDRLSLPSGCPLCQFFGTMRIQPKAHKNYKLLAFCSSESWLFNLPAMQKSDTWDKIAHTVFMAVVPDIESLPPNGHQIYWLEEDIRTVGLIYRYRVDSTGSRQNILGARKLGQQVNYSILREWASFCVRNHAPVCQPEESKISISRGFRLIDCIKSPPVVENKPSETCYVALSYVWGNQVQEAWPRTVQDAVAVTKAMGLQYLWVDRLCISQDNYEEKQYLISIMDKIYSGAEFTIVAAAGEGSNYGLPGVGSKDRTLQPRYELESGSVLLSTMEDPRIHISKSEWYKRGWTYQESILSTRRLVFTDCQAYWECQCMAIHESVSISLDLVHGTSGQRMADFMLSGFLGNTVGNGEAVIGDDTPRLDYGFPPPTHGSMLAILRELEEHIRSFSLRKLTDDADSLRAFQGIISLYHLNNIRWILGVPFWTGDSVGKKLGTKITFALSISSWYHRSSADLQMFASEQCCRRHHMPSWTWAGWEGAISWRAPPAEEHCAIMNSLIEAETLDFLWAADICIQNAKTSASTHLTDMISVPRSESEDLMWLEVRDPLILTEFVCIPVPSEEKPWSWRKLAGRSGMNQHDVGNMSWDLGWLRLAGKLVFRSVSITITTDEWSRKHESGDFISILMFAGRLPVIQHGRARFLTLRKVQLSDADEYWERVGIMQLQISKHVLARCRTEEEFLAHLPVRHESGCLVVR